MSALALYLAGLCDYRDKLSPGEKGVVLLFAPDLKQAKVALDYAEGALQATPLMRQLLAARTADTLTLTNGIRLEVRSASFRRIRGMTAVAALADKCAFWKSEDSANPDVEILKCSTPSSSHDTGAWIVMEYDVEQRVMNVNVAVVVDQAELAKLVHEQTHSRPGGPDHFGECALAYFYFCGFGFSFRGEISQEEKLPCEALFAGIEKLINQISLYAGASGQNAGNEELRKLRVFVDGALDGCIVEPQ